MDSDSAFFYKILFDVTNFISFAFLVIILPSDGLTSINVLVSTRETFSIIPLQFNSKFVIAERIERRIVDKVFKETRRNASCLIYGF